MAEAKHTTVPAAGKLSDEKIGSFMCKLFDPLPDAEIEDKELKRLESKARGAAKERSKTNWHRAYLAYMAARALYDFHHYRRLLRAHYPGEHAPHDAKAHQEAKEALRRATDVMFVTPATTQGELRWKRARLLAFEDRDSETVAARRKLLATEAERLGLPLEGDA